MISITNADIHNNLLAATAEPSHCLAQLRVMMLLMATAASYISVAGLNVVEGVRHGTGGALALHRSIPGGHIVCDGPIVGWQRPGKSKIAQLQLSHTSIACGCTLL